MDQLVVHIRFSKVALGKDYTALDFSQPYCKCQITICIYKSRMANMVGNGWTCQTEGNLESQSLTTSIPSLSG